jgi:hypothetical protein
MNNFFNHIPSQFSGKKCRKPGLFCLLLGLLFFASCSNHHCKEPVFVPLVVALYSDADTSVRISRNFLTVKAVGNDSINSVADSILTEWSNKYYNDWQVLLSLKNFKDSTRFLFVSTYNNESGESVEIKDTLTVKHTNIQEFVSAECGCITTFELENTVHHTLNNITEITVLNQSVTSSIAKNQNEKHIKILFKNY